MRLDSLTRLIETADFLSFREIALKCLALRGFRSVSLRDGWRDGGTDLQVFQAPPNPTNLAVQVSVERDWRSKVRTDAKKAKDELSLDNFLFISSRRIPEAEFQTLSDELWRTDSIRATRIDSQSIASTFFEASQTTDVLNILGIPIASQTSPTPMHSARLDAAYSFVFFGKETDRFREQIAESAIIACLSSRDHPIARKLLENEASEILQLSDRQRQVIVGTIDRMLQRGDLVGRSEAVALNARIRDAAAAMRSLKDRAWADLRSEVSKFLANQLKRGKVTNKLADAVMEDLGALLAAGAQATMRATEHREGRSAIDAVFNRLRHLHATLDGAGIPEGSTRNTILERLADIASNSPVGKDVLAGELFIAMSSTRTPHLIRALGARSGIEVLLDASVAIPILASLLFSPSAHRYFLAAEHAYKQLSTLKIRMTLPDEYLEAVASHLVTAKHHYEPIIESEPDLIASENAFVAHYAGLLLKGDAMPFADYLRGLGYATSLNKADFYSARDALKPKLERLFSNYDIRTEMLRHKKAISLKRAEESVARAINTLKIDRPRVLLEHDARIISFLVDREVDADKALIMCTWDKLYFGIMENEQFQWDVMNPAALGDVLSLTSPHLRDAPVASTLVIAKAISEEAAHAGALVWDTLVRIEKGSFYDAQLLAQAQEFKKTYLRQKGQGLASSDIAQAWVEWKNKSA